MNLPLHLNWNVTVSDFSLIAADLSTAPGLFKLSFNDYTNKYMFLLVFFTLSNSCCSVLVCATTAPPLEAWICFRWKPVYVLWCRERCLLAFKDALPRRPLWCDLTEDEKPQVKIVSRESRASEAELPQEKGAVYSRCTALPTLPPSLSSSLHCCISMKCLGSSLQHGDAEQSVNRAL